MSGLLACVFVALYSSHMVADHVVQTDWQAVNKAAASDWLKPMGGHLAGYLTCQAVAVGVIHVVGVSVSLAGTFAGLAFSVVSHGFIDRRWPVRRLLERTGSATFSRLAGNGLNGMYLADQSLHIGCLFVAALIVTSI